MRRTNSTLKLKSTAQVKLYTARMQSLYSSNAKSSEELPLALASSVVSSNPPLLNASTEQLCDLIVKYCTDLINANKRKAEKTIAVTGS